MTMATITEDAAKNILRQVEFYFSDSNLPRDNFLRKSIEESEDGLISLGLICSFTRMKNHLGLDASIKAEDISEETVSAVAETLKKSSVLKLSEDGKRVGRSTELAKPDEVIEQVDIRTIAASPLEYNVKLEDVNSVRLPRHVSDKKYFSGSALVEFSTEEDANNILNQSLVYAGAELELKSKKDFDAEREKQLEQFESSRSSMDSNKRNGSHVNDNYPKDLIVAFKLKSMSEGGSAEQNGTEEVLDTATIDKMEEANSAKTNEGSEEKASENVKDGNEKSADDIEIENEEKQSNSTTNIHEGSEENASENGNGEKQPNSTMNIDESEEKASENVKDGEEKPADVEKENGEKVQNSTTEREEQATEDAIQESEEKNTGKDSIQESKEKGTFKSSKENADVVLREDLRNVFQRYGTVKYIDYSMGEESGYIRFEHSEAAQKARAAAALALDGGLIVKNFIASLEPVTGDAEREYWSLLRGNQGRHKGNRGRGRNNRGGRHYGGKHPRSRESDSAGGGK